MIYCGEWLQNWNGTIERIRLKDDLSGTIGEGEILFRAFDSPWSREIIDGKESPSKVTDGPCSEPAQDAWVCCGQAGYMTNTHKAWPTPSQALSTVRGYSSKNR